ncbi:MAG TPA: site-2 protease family protein, partial [Alphaproteobacteria bacterium]|nr:site-2 protease family protein [Alphaproteobacteria bacterium]
MDVLSALFTNVVPFLVVLTVLVFVHEMGHFLIARWNGVRVEVFSIGFGPELFGRTDRTGTRWKVSAIPLGGYVKFFGDMNPASAADTGAGERMSPEERAVSFHHKSLPGRAAIVAAGPLANFVYAVIVLAVLFMVVGQRLTPPEIGRVMPDSAGAAAGFQAGDVVLSMNGD